MIHSRKRHGKITTDQLGSTFFTGMWYGMGISLSARDIDSKPFKDLLPEREILRSAASRRAKVILFLEQILEADQERLMKWKHFWLENEIGFSKIPKWFEIIEITEEGTRKLKEKYLIKNFDKRKIHMKLFDENEKVTKNSLVTWNDEQGIPIFGEDKKKSQSKNYKRLGLHLVPRKDVIDMDNSPFLIKYEGCERNVGRKEKDNSRVIKRRLEGFNIKPYETLRNIIDKNKWVKNYSEEDKRDREFNFRIEMFDNLIKAENDFIEILKNSIYEREDFGIRRKVFWLVLDCLKIKSKIIGNGRRIFDYLVTWIIIRDEGNEERKEIRFTAKFEIKNETNMKFF
ncbi:hypothetical protein RhiirA5_425994 [Rhizophagus irregularis]|uniref:Uncharacterized protein n=1 Tax=Rhizophagus irregularis TaxID=588596 RepID=A0A2N0P514_9GLOM|nr:hypothetical protein RhiirA5_425994 [Rhizophagus irregularis]